MVTYLLASDRKLGGSNLSPENVTPKYSRTPHYNIESELQMSTLRLHINWRSSECSFNEVRVVCPASAWESPPVSSISMALLKHTIQSLLWYDAYISFAICSLHYNNDYTSKPIHWVQSTLVHPAMWKTWTIISTWLVGKSKKQTWLRQK